MTSQRLVFSVALASSIALAAHGAIAQSGDSAVAESLFREGRALLEQGKIAEACPKLAESARLERRIGTLLTLAICREREGKTATAWAMYSDVMSLAKRENRADREKTARDRMTEIEPKLSRLSIVVPDSLRSIPGLDVRRDGEVVGAGAFGVAVPLDPGPHTVTASATGKVAWTANVTLAASSDRRIVELPPRLDEAPVAAPLVSAPPPASAVPMTTSTSSAPPDAPLPASRSGKNVTAGYVVGGVGAAALLLGTVFAIRSASKESEARKTCPTNSCADPNGVQANQDARSAYPIAVIGIGFGVAGLATGAILLLTSSNGAPASSTALPRGPRASLGKDGASIGWESTW